MFYSILWTIPNCSPGHPRSSSCQPGLHVSAFASPISTPAHRARAALRAGSADYSSPVIVPTIPAADALRGVSLRHCRVHPTTLQQEGLITNDQKSNHCLNTQELFDSVSQLRSRYRCPAPGCTWHGNTERLSKGQGRALPVCVSGKSK